MSNMFQSHSYLLMCSTLTVCHVSFDASLKYAETYDALMNMLNDFRIITVKGTHYGSVRINIDAILRLMKFAEKETK